MNTARLDTSSPALVEAIADVRSDGTDTNWCIFTYEGKSTIVLKGKGSGGVNEMRENLEDGSGAQPRRNGPRPWRCVARVVWHPI